MRRIFVVEYHNQVLDLWRVHNISSQKVLHLDFHCDLRGLLIDREAQRAYRIRDRFADVDEGNFLTHAILDGIITGVRWVHDKPGGREDDLKSVKYKSDMTALFHRCIIALRARQGVPIRYEVIPQIDWAGLQSGELLDIDWDFFASKEYPVDTVQQRVDAFLSRDWGHVPEQTYVCYSPNYSHPTRKQFRRFIESLASRFNAEIVDVPASATTHARKSTWHGSVWFPLYRAARDVYHRANLALRKRGIY